MVTCSASIHTYPSLCYVTITITFGNNNSAKTRISLWIHLYFENIFLFIYLFIFNITSCCVTCAPNVYAKSRMFLLKKAKIATIPTIITLFHLFLFQNLICCSKPKNYPLFYLKSSLVVLLPACCWYWVVFLIKSNNKQTSQALQSIQLQSSGCEGFLKGSFGKWALDLKTNE